MSGSRKTLFRCSGERKCGSGARIHISNNLEQSEKISLAGSVSLTKCTRYSERSTDPSKDGVTVVECETNEKAIKRLNIPFDEVVYQDLISLNKIRMKLKSDEFSRLVDRPRNLKKLDPEPDLGNFFRPTKQEFLFCDLLGKNFDPDGEEVENSQSYNFMAIECDDKVTNDFDPDAVGGSESGKPSVCEELDLESLDVDTFSIEKFRLLHENYGLDPPQMKSHFVGPSLYNRSQAWKLS